MSPGFAESTARIQQSIHDAAGWEHSVLLIIRPAVPEAAVIHVDDGTRVWGGATRSPAQIERLRRAAEAVRADDEQDISDVVEAFDLSRDSATMQELMGSHVKVSGEQTDAAPAIFLVRDRDADASMTARWKDGRTLFVDEPLGHTDALLVDAAAYAEEPMLETRGSKKGSVRLSSRTRAGEDVSGPSALMRYLRLELPELVPWIEPFDSWLAQQDAPVQAAAWLWARIAAAIEISVEQDETGVVRDALDDLAEDQEGYWLDEDRYGREGNPIPAIIGSLIGGVWEDMQADDPEPRLEELFNAAANTAVSINRTSTRWGLAYDTSATHLALASFMSWYEDARAAVGLSMALPEVQRLWWMGECLHRKGIALSGNSAPAFPADEMECVRLLCRMAANQPTLACAPELAKYMPLRADRWMSLTDRSHRAIDELDLPDDPELARRLADEIRHHRHFALDHIAIVEVDELGIDRIVLTPEERADDRSSVVIKAIIEHQRGCFVATTIIDTGDETDHERASLALVTGQPTVTFAPAFMTDRTAEAHTSPLELVLLSAWRDLVVADVREQQYEAEVLRKGKGKARKGRAGDVVRYLPRRVALRRAEAAARAATGEPTLRRLYPVGAFAKRLPEGQRRSAEAETFAAEIGIPLADHQTVVRAHWRGGTEQERQAAAEAADAPERLWRSWSALDLIRTRRRDTPA